MNQDIFPEIRVATEALESRIAITEAEVAQMKEGIASKKELRRSWRKALATFNPKRATPKKRIAPRKTGASASSAAQQKSTSSIVLVTFRAELHDNVGHCSLLSDSPKRWVTSGIARQ